jgi:hypothetical protein
MNNKIVPRQCLEQIVEYVKTGQINIDPTNVWDLYLACDYCCIFFFLSLCDYCCINEITEKCQKYFVQTMNINNLENLIRMVCTTSNCTTLLDEICDYNKENTFENTSSIFH